MTETQWQRVKEIFGDAVERDASGRTEFIEVACAGDAEVHQEVLRLLTEADSSKEDILSDPPFNFRRILQMPAPSIHCFVPGQKVAGRFRIERFLNRGGMGEVYAALDLELNESVALKTINRTIASSASAIERFKLEVKESRRITDSSVCRVYDLFSHEQPDGEPIWFLTMELLEGQTLASALASRGAMPPAKALPLIKDMVVALSAAHALGVVHRDFKPSNVMLVQHGDDRERALVTDFGLALNLSRERMRTTIPGDGTPAYMAPEQVTGEAVGLAADQFALGLVIAEMLTGDRPELDRSSPEKAERQLKEWLNRQPRQKLNTRTRSAIRRCLEFQPDRRFPHVKEIVPAIEGIRRRTLWRWTTAAAFVISALVFGLTRLASGNGDQVKNPVLLTPESGLSNVAAISRDGKWIVYSSDRSQTGNLDIWIQAAAGGPARRLTTHPAAELDPSISPDGKLIAFRSERDGGGIYLVGSDGTGEHLLVPGGSSPAFSPDGRTIAFWLGTRDDAAPSGGMYLVSPEGGQPRQIAGDFADARYPIWDSTGQFLLFEGCKGNTASLATCADWWVIHPDGTGARNTGALALLKSHQIELPTPPQKAWRGNEIFFSGSQAAMVAIWSLRLARQSMHAEGLPRRLTAGNAEREPAVAENGSIVFGRITAALHIWRVPLQQDSGRGTQVTDDPALDGCPSVSPDGKWLFFTRKIRGVRQLLVRELATGRESTIFNSGDNKFWPIASPVGDRAVFEVRKETSSSLWVVDRSGAGLRILCQDCSHPTSWFGSGKVFYTTAAGEIALLDVSNGKSQVALSPVAGTVLGGADWNPETQSLLFTVDRQGAKQIFSVRFPLTGEKASGPWMQLTQEIAELDQPRWSADGKVFYFLSKRDTFNCLWGRSFLPGTGATGEPFLVAHYHDLRFSPDRASPLTRGMTVASDSIFLSVGEVTDTLWLGRLVESPLASLARTFSFWR